MTQPRAFAASAAAAFLSILVAACGGGGGGGGDGAPAGAAPPVAAPPSGVASAPTGGPAVITLTSDAGDYIGQGRSYAYNTGNAGIRIATRGAQLDVEVAARESWSATFVLPGTSNQLQPGTYGGLGRHPFQPAGSGAMSWTGESRGCNVLAGTLVIDSVSYEGGRLRAIDLHFEQRCDGAAAALRGRIRVDAQQMSALTPPQNALPGQPVVALTSETGDYIGAGGTYAYDAATATINVSATGGLLEVRVNGDEQWTGTFKMPGNATTLAPGTYDGLVRHPFQPAGTGGLSWWGEGRGCNTLTGSATIHTVRYDTAGALAAIDLSFVQHCEGGPAALRGRITWDAAAPVPAPGPAPTPPAGLWQPPDGAMPASGNAMYVTSEGNDYVGAGYTFWVGGGGPPAGTPSDVQGTVAVNLSEAAGLLQLRVTGTVNWVAEFKAMNGVARLQPGYYGIVQRYPFHNPARGGMSITMDSRACNELSGWFMVDSVTYEGDRLVAVDLRFAQHCDRAFGALRGRIRWSTATAPR